MLVHPRIMLLHLHISLRHISVMTNSLFHSFHVCVCVCVCVWTGGFVSLIQWPSLPSYCNRSWVWARSSLWTGWVSLKHKKNTHSHTKSEYQSALPPVTGREFNILLNYFKAELGSFNLFYFLKLALKHPVLFHFQTVAENAGISSSVNSFTCCVSCYTCCIVTQHT